MVSSFARSRANAEWYSISRSGRLQSTNEELETTNEELQSGNEELETMNEEMRLRTAELDESRIFLEGVLSSVAAGVVVLDAELLVRSWNSGAEELWGLRADEVRNQAFFNLDFGLPVASVRDIVHECLTTGRRAGPVQVAAINRKGRSITCIVACSPLRGKGDGDGEGAVLLMEERFRRPEPEQRQPRWTVARPARRRGNAARAASAWGPSWGGTKRPPDRHQPEPVRACLGASRRRGHQPGTQQPPADLTTAQRP